MGKHTGNQQGNTSIGKFGAMTVSERSRRTGVPSHVVRYYARIGLLKPARNRARSLEESITVNLLALRCVDSHITVPGKKVSRMGCDRGGKILISFCKRSYN